MYIYLTQEKFSRLTAIYVINLFLDFIIVLCIFVLYCIRVGAVSICKRQSKPTCLHKILLHKIYS